jgi:hypothetical protein
MIFCLDPLFAQDLSSRPNRKTKSDEYLFPNIRATVLPTVQRYYGIR